MSYDHMTLTCPHCQREASGVVETRAHQNVVYRRRVCRACKGRVTTAEQVTGSAGIKGGHQATGDRTRRGNRAHRRIILQHLTFLVALTLAAPALASTDMSHAEFFSIAQTGQWREPPSSQTLTRTARVAPHRQGVADMVAKETAKRLGAQWVPTALRLTKLESGFNCGAIGPKTRHGRAQGLLQVMPGTARGMGYNPARLRECHYGLMAGLAHMEHCIRSGVRTHAQMASCHVSGFHGWKVRLNARSERYRQKYVRLAAR